MSDCCPPMERKASSSLFCIYSLLDLFFTLEQPFIKASIFRVGIEARAGLTVGVVTVAVDATAVHLDQIIYLFLECGLLCGCSGICIITVFIEASNITNPDGMGVMFETVCAYTRNRATLLPLAVSRYHIVISDISPMLFVLVVLPYLFDTVAVDGLGSRTMYDDIVYISHGAGGAAGLFHL